MKKSYTVLAWLQSKRYKVNEVVLFDGAEYQNITGRNSSPDLLVDWVGQLKDNNRITSIPTPPYTFNSTTKVLTMTAGWEATINNVNVTTGPQTLSAIADATDGYSRIDLVSLGVNGIFAITQGQESLSTAIKPLTPANHVEAFPINVFGDQVFLQQIQTLLKFPDSSYFPNTAPLANDDSMYLDRATNELYTFDTSIGEMVKVTDTDKASITQLNAGLATKLDASLYNDRFKGKFTSLVNLEAALPTANAGDYAQVDTGSGFDVQNYNYDLEDGWILGGDGTGATNTDALVEGSTNLYFTTARVLSTLLSGLSLLTGGAIVSTDSVLTAFGKLQKQITDAIAQLFWVKVGDNIQNNNTGGNVNIKLTGTDTSDRRLNILDASGARIASIRDAGNFETWFEGGGLFGGTGLGASVTFEGRTMLLRSVLTGNSQTAMVAFNTTQLGLKTSGVLDIIGFRSLNINPTSGNAIFNILDLEPIINQTGGANGITRGIYVNPTLTSASDFRALEITNGKVIIPPATASNEAVNLSQLESENNVYLSHEMIVSNNSADFNIASINAGTIGGVAPTINNVGVQRFSSSANANSGIAIRGVTLQNLIKGNEIFTYIFNPLTFINTTSRLGIHDSTTSALPANGIYFEYSGNGDLKTVTENSNTITSQTLATLTANTWYKVRFTVNANASSVLFELFNASGVLSASTNQTANIPANTTRLNICAITTNSGTTPTALIDVDFISTRLTLIR